MEGLSGIDTYTSPKQILSDALSDNLDNAMTLWVLVGLERS